MQTLDRLSKLVGAASTAASAVGDAVRRAETLRFPMPEGSAFYLHAEHADLTVTRYLAPAPIIGEDAASTRLVTLEARWQPPFAWRVVSERDEAGVYVVALRRRALRMVGMPSGGLLTMRLMLSAPRGVPVILRLEHVRLTVDEVSGVIEMPADGTLISRY